MAQFDVSQAVNNILSSEGSATRKSSQKTTGTTPGLGGLPGLGGISRKLPGVKEALGTDESTQKSEFNPFDLVAARGAVVMADELIRIAEEAEGDGLDVAIGALDNLGELVGEVSGLVTGLLEGNLTTAIRESAQGLANTVTSSVGEGVLNMVGLRQHALKIFVAHYPPAHEKIKIEPLDRQSPNLVSRAGSRATPAEENRVSFWREDAQLNEHHGRWHEVYPTGAAPPSSGEPVVIGDRHGELFVYMHVQMLARYDAERLAVGLSRVEPFGDYRAKLAQGYDPGPKVGRFDEAEGWVPFKPRPADVNIQDLTPPGDQPPLLIADQERFRDALREAARDGFYQLVTGPNGQPVAVDSDNLGNTSEASIESIDWPDRDNPNNPENGANYGNLHGSGHTHIAVFENRPPIGVMLNLNVTCRDPMFWRWHKHIDTIIQIWRERLGEREPHDFSDGPPVTVRGEDIIICREEGLPASLDEAALGVLGATAFGDAAENLWDTDFSADQSTTVSLPGGLGEVTVATTAELVTEMRTRAIKPKNPETEEPEEETIYYLSHEDFAYFIRLQNRSEQAQTVTVRIFLAPESGVQDNTSWIEMDRFMYGLEGGERAVVFRPARQAAVIRKPAVGHEELEGTKPRGADNVWCNCGWPYNLLLPRGTKEGMEFRLLVMLSTEDLTVDDTGEKCTSISYCGLQQKTYPDRRPMGYPFDRTLPDDIDSIINKHDNWASRKIRIRCRNPEHDSVSA